MEILEVHSENLEGKNIFIVMFIIMKIYLFYVWSTYTFVIRTVWQTCQIYYLCILSRIKPVIDIKSYDQNKQFGKNKS